MQVLENTTCKFHSKYVTYNLIFVMNTVNLGVHIIDNHSYENVHGKIHIIKFIKFIKFIYTHAWNMDMNPGYRLFIMIFLVNLKK